MAVVDLWDVRTLGGFQLSSLVSTEMPWVFFSITLRIGLPWWFSSKDSTCSEGDSGDLGSIPGSGRSPGRGHGNPLQYSCLENPVDRGAWWATVHGVTKSQHNWATKPPPAPGDYEFFLTDTQVAQVLLSLLLLEVQTSWPFFFFFTLMAAFSWMTTLWAPIWQGSLSPEPSSGPNSFSRHAYRSWQRYVTQGHSQKGPSPITWSYF